MINTYQNIINLLRSAFAETGDRKVKIRHMIHAENALMASDDACRQAVLQYLQKSGKRMAGNQQVLLRSLLFFLAKTNNSIRDLAVLLQNYTDDLECYHYLVWKIRISIFTFGGNLNPEIINEIRETYIRPTYHKVTSEILDSIHGGTFEKRSSGIGKIGIVLSQFLGDLHAPSRLALSIATGLAKLYNLNVHIINSNLLPSTLPLDYFYGTLPNINKEFKGLQRATYEDSEFGEHVFYLKSFEGKPFELDHLIEFWNEVEAENYDALINLGDVLFATDFFYGKIPVLSIPMVNDLPVSPANQLVLADKVLTDTEKELVEKYFPQGAILGFNLNITTKAGDKEIKRSDFEIPDDAFVYVVLGNRLHFEIDTPFLSMIQAIVDADSKNYVVFVSPSQSDVKILVEQCCKNDDKRLKFLPFQKNLAAFYSICNVYINPTRKGGGLAAQMAIAQHIPVLTTDYGDCTIYVPVEYRLSSYEDMLKLAIEMSLNSEILDLWKERMQMLSTATQSGENNIRILYMALLDLQKGV